MHASQAEKARREAREGEFKYDGQWRKRRRAWLSEHPLCASCQRRGIVKPATDVDHVIALSAGGLDDEINYESKCHECHSYKTATEDGGFGRARRDSRSGLL